MTNWDIGLECPNHNSISGLAPLLAPRPKACLGLGKTRSAMIGLDLMMYCFIFVLFVLLIIYFIPNVFIMLFRSSQIILESLQFDFYAIHCNDKCFQ